MMGDKAGNTVVPAGNNREKARYISRSLQAGLNVLADKPMVINQEDFGLLRQAFDTAASTCLFGKFREYWQSIIRLPAG